MSWIDRPKSQTTTSDAIAEVVAKINEENVRYEALVRSAAERTFSHHITPAAAQRAMMTQSLAPKPTPFPPNLFAINVMQIDGGYLVSYVLGPGHPTTLFSVGDLDEIMPIIIAKLAAAQIKQEGRVDAEAASRAK